MCISEKGQVQGQVHAPVWLASRNTKRLLKVLKTSLVQQLSKPWEKRDSREKKKRSRALSVGYVKLTCLYADENNF